jgi:hypothetical protein
MAANYLPRARVMSKRDFLDNLRAARNLCAHGDATAGNQHLDPAALERTLIRAAIWLSPSSMKGFRPDDFQELGKVQQQALADAVQAFDQIARQVPPDGPATDKQLKEGRVALEKILTILVNYLPDHEEAVQIRTALAKLDFPNWVVNWDYEPGSDDEGAPAVWITVYADEQVIRVDQYGRGVGDLLPKFRSTLTAAGIRRWPYIRLRTAREYKAG